MSVILAMAFALFALPGQAQQPYPPHIEQGLTWSTGTHHVAVTQRVLSPADPYHPVAISATADAELVSGTSVHLTDGFHAGGFSSTGRFHAYIDDGLGAPGDVVAIVPDSSHVINNALHVPKWEKVELGLQLPAAYTSAIDSFFVHYYTNGPNADATPYLVDAAHDLNPYADDSLLLVMRLTDPSDVPRMKWGFYMREGKWASTDPAALLTEDTTSTTHPYTIRFRFAPDEEGPWQFDLSVQAPYTTTPANNALPALHYTGYGLVCDPPLPDNHGPLHVNQVNHRTLQFEDGTSYFGLGTNMADKRSTTQGVDFTVLCRRDHTMMSTTMAQLHSVGGNFMRMFMLRGLFCQEWVNLGVYDQFHYTHPASCPSGADYGGNCQYQLWALDQLLDTARANDLYLQLCVDPYPPGFGSETYLWNANAYVLSYLNNHRDGGTGRYDTKQFFYSVDGNGQRRHGDGVFYYWKRKYKYLMARWGYAVNIAAIEPFNEVDQMLGYRYHPVSGDDALDHTLCEVNRMNDWPQDPELPGTVSDWFTDITSFVRGAVDTLHPATSPLGEDKKLFALSYAKAAPEDTAYNRPYRNPNVDLIDVHHYPGDGIDEARNTFTRDSLFRETYLSDGHKKPFHDGEYDNFEYLDANQDTTDGAEYDASKIFDNYDVSFHNMLWASTFYGNFAAASAWFCERVFWWPDALPQRTGLGHIPNDPNNPFEAQHSGVLGANNLLHIGLPFPDTIRNRTVYHNIKPLADLLFNSAWQNYDFLSGGCNPHKVYNSNSGIECYYLLNADSNVAIGWVHNLHAHWINHYYATRDAQNFLGCTSPTVQQITLPGFQPGPNYYISFFATRMSDTIHPVDTTDVSGSGTVLLDLSSAPLTGLTSFPQPYLDTLHADYAFIISPFGHVRNLVALDTARAAMDKSIRGFIIYPNPAHDVVHIKLPDDLPRDITLIDLTGRVIYTRRGMTGRLLSVALDGFSSGAYALRIMSPESTSTRTLIIR